MSEVLQKFDEAKSDRIVDKEDLKTVLQNFTVDDWRQVAQVHNKHANPLKDFWVEEKDEEFLVHNDKDAIHDEKILSGVWSVVRGAGLTALGAAVGWGVGAYMRRNPIGWVGGAALGAITGIGLGMRDSNRIEEIERTAFPLVVAKSSLVGGESETAMLQRSSSLSKMLLAKAPIRKLNLAG